MAYSAITSGGVQFDSVTGIADSGAADVAPIGIPTGYAGTILGALKYNLNELTGWFIGMPSNSDVYVYSDLCFSVITTQSSTVYDQLEMYVDVLAPTIEVFTPGSTTYSDQILVNIIGQIMYRDGKYREGYQMDDVLQSGIIDIADYEAAYSKSDGLFNIPFLPWNVMGVLDTTANVYRVKTYLEGVSTLINVNPLRKEVLWIKFITLLKIAGILSIPITLIILLKKIVL